MRSIIDAQLSTGIEANVYSPARAVPGCAELAGVVVAAVAVVGGVRSLDVSEEASWLDRRAMSPVSNATGMTTANTRTNTLRRGETGAGEGAPCAGS